MHPRPLYRWKSFWLGVVILISLGLFWSSGQLHRHDITLSLGRDTWIGTFNSSGYLYGFIEASGTGTFHSRDYLIEPFSTTAGPWFRRSPIVVLYMDNPPTTLSATGIAHWLLSVGFLLPWTAFLTWRWRGRGGSAPHAPDSRE